MQVIEKETLFAEITSEEAGIVSGGVGPTSVDFDWNTYFFYIGVGGYLGLPALYSSEQGYQKAVTTKPAATA